MIHISAQPMPGGSGNVQPRQLRPVLIASKMAAPNRIITTQWRRNVAAWMRRGAGSRSSQRRAARDAGTIRTIPPR